jgi:hypothetical protein
MSESDGLHTQFPATVACRSHEESLRSVQPGGLPETMAPPAWEDRLPGRYGMGRWVGECP